MLIYLFFFPFSCSPIFLLFFLVPLFLLFFSLFLSFFCVLSQSVYLFLCLPVCRLFCLFPFVCVFGFNAPERVAEAYMTSCVHPFLLFMVKSEPSRFRPEELWFKAKRRFCCRELYEACKWRYSLVETLRLQVTFRLRLGLTIVLNFILFIYSCLQLYCPI